MTRLLYLALLTLLIGERVAEMFLSRRNRRHTLSLGGREVGQRHFPAMVALHTSLFAACALEVYLLERPLIPWLAAFCVAVLLLAQFLRYWAISSLGRFWNVRVIVVPGSPAITEGPYRFVRHPNYIAVVLEGLAIPLVHGNWLTALGFTVLNAALLQVRIQCEEAALITHARGYAHG